MKRAWPASGKEVVCHLRLGSDDFVMQNHRVHGVSVLPGVVFFDIVSRILVARGADLRRAVLREVLFEEPVVTEPGHDREIRITLTPGEGEVWQVRGESRWRRPDAGEDDWHGIFRGRLLDEQPVEREPLDPAALHQGAVRRRDMEELYGEARREGIVHGERMKGLGSLFLGETGLLAKIELSPEWGHDAQRFHLHPALLDASTLAAFGRGEAVTGEPFIPIFVDRFRAPRPWGVAGHVRVPRCGVLASSGDVVRSDVELYDASGRWVGEMGRLTCKRIRTPQAIRRLLRGGSESSSRSSTLTAARIPATDRIPAEAVAVAPRTEIDPPGSSDEARSSYRDFLRRRVAELLEIEPEAVDCAAGFYDLGLDSLALLGLGRGLEERVGCHLDPTLLFEFTDIDRLADHLAGRLGALPPARSTTESKPRRDRPRREAPAAESGAEPAPLAPCLWLPRWSPAHVDGAASGGPGALLLFGAPEGLECELRSRSRGRIVSVETGEELEETAPDHFRLAPTRRQSWIELLRHLEQSGERPGAAVVVSPATTAAPSWSRVRSDCLVFRSLAKALVEVGLGVGSDLIHLALCSADDAGSAVASALASVARTVTLEVPTLRSASLRIEPPAGDREVAEALLAELAAGVDEPEVRLREGQRSVRRHLPWTLGSAEGAPPLRKGGVYLLAGGSGALGGILAETLARRFEARLLVVGRDHESPALTARLARLESLGGVARYCSADVARLADAERAVAEARATFGRLDGIFHGAGVLRDGLFFRQPAETWVEVLAPKVAGVINLDAASRNDPLDCFVLFSSATATLPRPGQSAYAAANAYLDGFASWRARQGDRSGKSLSIGWPLWAEGGMGGDSATLARDWRDLGTRPLPSEQGMDLLLRGLAEAPERFVVLYGDPLRIADLLPTQPPEDGESTNPDAGSSAAPRAGSAGSGIAVVGLAGQYPAAPDLATFWRNLVQGVDAVEEIPPRRWDPWRDFVGDKGHEGKTYSRWGGFLDGFDLFDPQFFGISRRDAERMDPQERLFLKTCWWALEDAGYPPETLGDEVVGVFVGVTWNHYQLYAEDAGGVAPTAMHASIANRVSYCFDFDGPSLAVDTACSSSLTAIHLALESLGRGECTLALAGGVNLSLHPQKYLQLAQGQFLSATGRCHSFGRDADGYVPGEGVGVVLLKPLRRARRSRDTVHGVLRGSSLNHTGRTAGYTVPSPNSQEALIRKTLEQSGIAGGTLGYVEAHGTGTELGDPIEVEGLRRVFAGGFEAPRSCALGSVKSNIGHLESAAGIAGLTKVLLQMKHRQLVPSLHAEELNPRLGLEDSPFFVVRRGTPWEPPGEGEPLRAGVSSFGAGGANAHLLVESYEAEVADPGEPSDRPREALFVLSARRPEVLVRYARSFVEWLDDGREQTTVSKSDDRIRIRVAELLGVGPEDIEASATLGDLGFDPPSLEELADRLAPPRANGEAPPPWTLETRIDSLGMAVHSTAADSGERGGRYRLEDVAFTSQVGRTAMPVRLAILARDLVELRQELERFVRGEASGETSWWGEIAEQASVEPTAGRWVEHFRTGNLRPLAAHWVAGGEIPWWDCYPAAGSTAAPRRVSLPTYPFDEERCWVGGFRRLAAETAPTLPKQLPTSPPTVAIPETREPSGVDPATVAGEPLEWRLLDPGIALVLLREPSNMFSERLVASLEATFEAVARRADVRVVVLTGTGDTFSLGATPQALRELAAKQRRFTDVPFLYEGLWRCPYPVIAAIQGHAAGGGLVFGLHADIVVLSRDAVYSANFLRHGFTPGMGATHVLERRFGVSVATEMFFTGRDFEGAELERRTHGLRFLPSAEVLPAALAVARAIAERPPEAVTALKRELSERVLAVLPRIVEREVALHEQVLGERAAADVERRFAKLAEPTVEPNVASPARPPKDPSPSPEPPAQPASAEAMLRSTGAGSPSGAVPRVGEDPGERIRGVLTEALGAHLYLEPHEIEDEQTFHQLGVDSIGAVEIVHALNRSLGLTLDSVVVYDHPTPARLRDHVLAELDSHRTMDLEAVRWVDAALDGGPAAPEEGSEPVPEHGPVEALPAAAPQAEESSPAPSPPAVVLASPALAMAASMGTAKLGKAKVGTATTGERVEAVRLTPTTPPVAGSAPGEGTVAESAGDLAIAVVGMAGRFPDATDLEAYWANLETGRCSLREVPGERWDVSGLYDADPAAQGKTVSRWGGMLEDVDSFDCEFFNLSAREAEAMDPQQRLFLEQAWTALENAGYTVATGRRCGVFVGTGSGDHLARLEAAGRLATAQAFLGVAPSILPARIAYHLDLQGPTLAVDTACSSSLVAVHLACESLRRGECELALAGGVALMTTPRMHLWTSQAGMLSPTGRCRPFDPQADGIVLGEGVGVVVLKRLSDALADGDAIHGVIEASGINGDGKTNGITAPSASSQADLLGRVYSGAGIDPASLGYLEAHGTGTPLGDPIEIEALRRFFGSSPGLDCVLGSVKANIGHTTLAAGIAGVLKVLLALRHHRRPPLAGGDTGEPLTELATGPLTLSRKSTPWPGAGRRRAGVSSFGFSGTNCHLVIGEAPTPAVRPPATPGRRYLVPISARSVTALRRRTEQLLDGLDQDPDLRDVVFTSALGRTHFRHRLAVVTTDRRDLRHQLRELLADDALRPPVRGAAESGPDPVGAPLESLAHDYMAGEDIDWQALCAGFEGRRIPLPTHPFDRRPHRLPQSEPEDSVATPSTASTTVPTPGRRRGEWTLDPGQALVADHRLAGRPVLPGVAGLRMVAEVVRQVGGSLPLRLDGVTWLRTLEVSTPTRVELSLEPLTDGPARFALSRAAIEPQDPPTVHVRGKISVSHEAPPPPLDVQAIARRCPRRRSGVEIYRSYAAAGLEYGPRYRVLDQVFHGPDEALGELVGDPQTTAEPWLPSALLDGALQTVAALVSDERSLLVPFAVDSVVIFDSPTSPLVAHARRLGELRFEVCLADREGRAKVCWQGLTLRPARPPRTAGRVDDMVYLPDWRPAAPLPTAAERGRRRVAILQAEADGELAEALLRAHGDDDAVAWGTAGRGQGEPPPPWDRIYLLARGRVDASIDGSTDELTRHGTMVTRVFEAIQDLLSGEQGVRSCQLVVVLGGAFAVDDDGPTDPPGAALLGMCRALDAEVPRWTVGCVDIGRGSDDLGEVARRLVREPLEDPLVVVRGASRSKRVVVPASLPTVEGVGAYRRRGVYAIVGGAGGLGMALSQHLARSVGARLAWIGRRGASPEIDRRREEIAALGGEAIYLRGDVTDRAEMEAALATVEERLGSLEGVFHSAMVLRDATLANLSREQLEAVLAPKVEGLAVLAEVLRQRRLDFLAVFSSSASFVAAAGQSNYAAASTFEDAFALALRRRHELPAVVINWGYWGSVGAVTAERYGRRFAALGVHSIEPAEGFEALDRILAAGVTQALVLPADPGRMADYGIEVVAPGGFEPPPAEGLERATRSYLEEVFASVLGPRAAGFGRRDTFENFGVDSLIGIDIVRRLEADLGDLPPTLLFEHTTLERLARHLLSEKIEALRVHLGDGAGVTTERSAKDRAPAIVEPVAQLRHPTAARRAGVGGAADGGVADGGVADGDIAVVGVGGRYPASPDLDTLWHNLAQGVDCVSEVPADRWASAGAFDGGKGHPNPFWGGFLEGIDRFDPRTFNILPREAATIDPQERLFLETCWHLLEAAGYHGEAGREPDTGVFVGTMYGSYGQLAAAAGWPRGELGGGHSAYWSLANRVSYSFDFRGPSFAVDSACSSSLTAVHLACEALRRGECRMAIAGGVNLILHPAHFVALAERNMLASGPGCRVFDADADGYVPGEGVGAVLLKSLSEARADGDRVWAVLKASRLNSGGKTSGFTVPNPNAQADLIAEAWRRADIPPQTVTYIEAHGTGTALGDPIEVRGLERAFRRLGGSGGPCAIGSVKANLGHLEGAAGIAGLTKVLLQLKHRQLAPTLHFDRPNPKIDFATSRFRPQRSLAPWPRPCLDLGDGEETFPRRAGVSSFGAGGANVHLVVEEYVEQDLETTGEGSGELPPRVDGSEHLFVLSTRTADQLSTFARRVASFLEDEAAVSDTSLAELAYTSQIGRREMPRRLAVRAHDIAGLARGLRGFLADQPSPSVWVGTVEKDSDPEDFFDGAEGLTSALDDRRHPELAAAWVAGVGLDWQRLWPYPRPRRTAFPTLPFERQRYWLPRTEGGASASAPPSIPASGPPARREVDPARSRASVCRYSRPVWVPDAPTAGERPPDCSLIVTDRREVGESLVRRLGAQGGGAVLVLPGEAFERLGEDTFRLALADRQAIGRLLDTLGDLGLRPDALVHATSRQPLTRPPGTDGGGDLESLASQLDHGLFSCLGLTTGLLARRAADHGLRVVFAHTSRDGQPQPQYAAVAATLKTLALEHTNLVACRVVLEGEETEEPVWLAERLAAEVTTPLDGVREHRYQGEGRWWRKLENFEPRRPGGEARELPLRPGGTYLITGGAGGVGLLCARHLAAHGDLRLVLVGRRPLGGDLRSGIESVSGEGVEVLYRPLDVTHPEEVERLVDELGSGGGLHGVIHAAGVRRDALAATKTVAEMSEVLAPKVQGTVILDRATRHQPLDFFVVFSSVVAESGNPGQADYAFANAFLDEFAVLREYWRRAGRRSGKTRSIGWPLWSEGGMTVDPATRRLLERRWGMVPMATADGLEALRRALDTPEPYFCVVAHRPAEGIDVGSPPARPPASAPEVPITGGGEGGGKRRDLEDQLRRLAASHLLVAPEEVELDAELLDLGFDSISLTELTDELNVELGLDLLPTVLFERPSLARLADYLESRQLPQSTAETVVEIEAPAVQVSAPEPPAPAPGDLRQDPRAIGRNEPIAIIGWSGRLPQCDDLEDFWRRAVAGDDLVGQVPDDRTDLRRDPRTRALRGGFLPRVDRFDARFFRISPREAALMDPQQRLFLEVVWRAIEDAGQAPSRLRGSATGLFVGVSTSDYDDLLRTHGVAVEAHTATGIAHSILANRVSHLLDLRGPSEAVDTACSSALVAVHRAVQALRAEECEVAVAGGVHVILSPGLYTAFGQAGMLSPEGRCKTFDRDADGYVRGEGVGAVVLKPLARALADGDPIHALIHGTAVNHGGRSNSLTAPNPEAQAEVIARAHRRSGIDPDLVSYLEAHGTGTPLGDPVEIEGIKKAFTERYRDLGRTLPNRPHIAIASVKSRIGHLEAAAGIAGLLSVLLAMRHLELPGGLHLRRPNPLIRLDGTPFELLDRRRRWRGRQDREGDTVHVAGVSAFGFGGSNAHLVVERYRSETRPRARRSGPFVFPLSAPTASALEGSARRLARVLEADPEIDLEAVAHTLQVGRQELAHRLAVVAEDPRALAGALAEVAAGTTAPASTYQGVAQPDAATASDGGSAAELAEQWVRGVVVPWHRRWPDRPPRRLSLPSFPFARDRHWFAENPSLDEPEIPMEPTRDPEPAGHARRIPKVRLTPTGGAAERHRPSGDTATEGGDTKSAGRGAAAEGGHPSGIPTPPQHNPGGATAATDDDGRRPSKRPSVAAVAKIVRRRLGELLALNADAIGEDEPFTDLGLDSIFMLDLVRSLNGELGLDLKAADLYERDTIRRLSEALGAPDHEPIAEPPPHSPSTPTLRPPALGPPGVGEPPDRRRTVVAPAEDGESLAGLPAGSPSESPSESSTVSRADPLAESLAGWIGRLLGRSYDRGRSFEANGFTSFEMLRVIAALEKPLGSLRKTLLFDHPTVDRLASHLESTHGARAHTALAELTGEGGGKTVATPQVGGAPGPRRTSARVLAKHRRRDDAEVDALLGRLEQRFGMESGLAGRDIAPWIFLGGSGDGYFHFARRDSMLLAWNYVGSSETFPQLVAELLAYARHRGLELAVLSMIRLEEVDGTRFSATPFGAIQRLEDLAAFRLEGRAMRRLRYLVRRFEGSGRVRTTEVRSGADAELDRRAAELVGRWCETKDMVNPYVANVRREIRRGRLAAHHRMFVTHHDDLLVNLVIITRIPSQPGYVLDLEFYGADMPLGGLEYAIVQIFHRLVEEGCSTFSFGASFGVQVGESPNADPEVAGALAELRTQGIFTGEGNFRFKNKFRPRTLPIFLCLPAESRATAVSEVILMIADPTPADDGGRQGGDTPTIGGDPATADPAPTVTGSPQPVVPEGPGWPTVEERGRLLEGVGWNPLRLSARSVELDVVTDSWAELEAPFVDRRRADLEARRIGRGRRVDDELGGFSPLPLLLPTASGRSAEALLCGLLRRRGSLVVQSPLFPSWTLAQLDHGLEPRVLTSPQGADGLFRADLDEAEVEEELDRLGDRVAAVCLELSNNALGGYPVSLAHLRRLREITRAHGVPLVLDATRIVENAVFVADHEATDSGVWQVVGEMLALADAATLSLSKDFALDSGGLLGLADPEWAEILRQRRAMGGHLLDVTRRRHVALALERPDEVVAGVRQRMQCVRTLWHRLTEAGVPVVGPPAGHCVLVDLRRIPGLEGRRHPQATFLAWLYHRTGIRAAPHLATAAGDDGDRWVRLAIPVGWTEATADEMGRRCAEAFDREPTMGELEPVSAAPGRNPALAAYRPVTAQTSTAEASDPRARDENTEVLREARVFVERRRLELPGGVVEVWTAGSGEPLLLLHPFNIGAGFFAPQFEELSQDHRLVVVHAPGVGATTNVRDLSFEGLARLALDAVRALGIEGPIHVGGASFGGVTAQAFALSHPEATATLTLIGSSHRVGNLEGEIPRLATVAAKDFDHLLSRVPRPDLDSRRGALIEHLLRCESMDPQTGLRYLDELAEHPGHRRRLTELEVPTLIVQGRYDSVVDLKAAHLMHGSIPDATYHELETAGHFPSLTDGDRFHRVLREFLRAHPISVVPGATTDPDRRSADGARHVLGAVEGGES